MFTHPLERTHVRKPLVLLVLLILHAGGGLFAEAVTAETWVCPRPGQTDLYSDHGGSGCWQLGEVKTYSSIQISPAPGAPPPVPKITPASVPPPTSNKPAPFPELSQPLPIVAIRQSTGGSASYSSIGLVAWLTVGYLANGTGPEILLDANLGPDSLRSLQMAVAVAAKAVGYDPKYLSVRLLVPAGVDGPSAGGIYAVGIASAVLGDPIRQDVCMSGTIEATLEIKPVGGLVDKMNACQRLNKHTMIVPDGLDNSHLGFKGAERAIHVIEVHTFAEAYYAATGQLLRQVPLY